MSELSVKIIDFKIEGFKGLNHEIYAKFSNDEATVLYGDNGCGKTTFLKTLAFFLQKNDAELAKLNIKKITATFFYHNNEVEVSVFNNPELQELVWNNNSVILDNLKSLSLGVERGGIAQTTNIPEEVIYDYFRFSNYKLNVTPAIAREIAYDLAQRAKKHNLLYRKRKNINSQVDFDQNHLFIQDIKMEVIENLIFTNYRRAKYRSTHRIQNALFDTLSDAVAITEKVEESDSYYEAQLIPLLQEKSERIIEALISSEDNRFKNMLIEILGDIKNYEIQQQILDNKLLRKLFANMLLELEYENIHLSTINNLIETFNSFLSENKKLVVNVDRLIIEVDGVEHSIEELSSGERHMITFLSLVLFVGNNRNFLIIDEPEISLNIKWQRSLIKLFKELLPNVQIIVASHSPFLAKNNPEYLAKLKVGVE
ncbi:AAA family ATPase [Acinetobacter baumannii]|nr:AAA family ATPase [Acinetobacter baumannii]